MMFCPHRTPASVKTWFTHPDGLIQQQVFEAVATVEDIFP